MTKMQAIKLYIEKGRWNYKIESTAVRKNVHKCNAKDWLLSLCSQLHEHLKKTTCKYCFHLNGHTHGTLKTY